MPRTVRGMLYAVHCTSIWFIRSETLYKREDAPNQYQVVWSVSP